MYDTIIQKQNPINMQNPIKTPNKNPNKNDIEN